MFSALPYPATPLWGQGGGTLKMQGADNKNSRNHGFLKVVQEKASNPTLAVLSLDLTGLQLEEDFQVTVQSCTGRNRGQPTTGDGDAEACRGEFP